MKRIAAQKGDYQRERAREPMLEVSAEEEDQPVVREQYSLSYVLRGHLYGIEGLGRHRLREHDSVGGLELHSWRDHVAAEGGLGHHHG